MNQGKRIAVAQETVGILDAGEFTSPGGRQVELGAQLARGVAETTLLQPEALRRLREKVFSTPSLWPATHVEARNETTLQGIERLVPEVAPEPVGVLNVASAKNPGGGFLGGAQAQEESLARSSGLYASLRWVSGFYEVHRQERDLL